MESKKFKCEYCGSKFSRNHNLNRHIQLIHSASTLNICELCGQTFLKLGELEAHHQENHPIGAGFIVRESAFRRSIINYRYIYPHAQIRIDKICEPIIQKNVKKTILYELLKKKSLKFTLVLIADMVQFDHNNEIITNIQVPFRSFSIQLSIHMVPEITKSISKSFDKIIHSIEEFQHCGSGYVFSHAIALDLEINKVPSLRIGTNVSNCLRKIPNHKYLENVPGEKYCLLYCIINFLFPWVDFQMNESLYKSCLKIFKGLKGKNKIPFPISIHNVEKFLKQNKHLDINVNILYYYNTFHGKEIVPVKFGLGGGSKTLNLLIIGHKKGHHFVIIKNLDKFLRKNYVDINDKKCYANTRVCPNCLNHFRSKNVLKTHQKLCLLKGAQKEICPEEGENKIYFKHYAHVVPQELVAFADFEACMDPTEEKCDICQTSLRCKCEQKSFTRTESIQKPICYSFVIVNNKNELLYEQYYAGEKANVHFLNQLLELEEGWLASYFANTAKLKMTEHDTWNFENAEICYLCNKPFTTMDDKVRGKRYLLLNLLLIVI